MEERVGPKKDGEKILTNENLSQNDDDMVVQNYTTPSNQLEKIKTLTPNHNIN